MKKLFLTLLISLNYVLIAQTYIDPNTNEIFVWNVKTDKFTYVAANQPPVDLNIINHGESPNIFIVKFPNKTINFTIEILEDVAYKKSVFDKTQIFYVASKSINTKPNIFELYKDAFEGYFYDVYNDDVLMIKKNNGKYESKYSVGNNWKNLTFKKISKSSFGLEFIDQNNNLNVFSKTIESYDLGENEGIKKINKDSSVTVYMQVDKNPNLNKSPLEIKEFYRNNYQRGGEVEEKPVIYFYPEKTQTIQVKMQNSENLIFTYPKLENSWSFVANPNGKLTFENYKEYNYLFWEGNTKTSNLEKNEGFIVEKENLTSFFEEKLSFMGLKPQEYNDFIVYWVPKMQKNETNWVSFAISSNEFSNENGKNLDTQFPLEISPNPETLFRVTLLYKPCSKDLKINEQKLTTFKRNGFTVVEWGGINLENYEN